MGHTLPQGHTILYDIAPTYLVFDEYPSFLKYFGQYYCLRTSIDVSCVSSSSCAINYAFFITYLQDY